MRSLAQLMTGKSQSFIPDYPTSHSSTTPDNPWKNEAYKTILWFHVMFSKKFHQLFQTNWTCSTLVLRFNLLRLLKTIAIIIKKLPYYYFTNKVCNLLNSYLSNRTQYVQIDQHKSYPTSVNIGVPQGSAQFYLSFILAISLMPHHPCSIISYLPMTPTFLALTLFIEVKFEKH